MLRDDLASSAAAGRRAAFSLSGSLKGRYPPSSNLHLWLTTPQTPLGRTINTTSSRRSYHSTIASPNPTRYEQIYAAVITAAISTLITTFYSPNIIAYLGSDLFDGLVRGSRVAFDLAERRGDLVLYLYIGRLMLETFPRICRFPQLFFVIRSALTSNFFLGCLLKGQHLWPGLIGEKSAADMLEAIVGKLDQRRGAAAVEAFVHDLLRPFVGPAVLAAMKLMEKWEDHPLVVVPPPTLALIVLPNMANFPREPRHVAASGPTSGFKRRRPTLNDENERDGLTKRVRTTSSGEDAAPSAYPASVQPLRSRIGSKITERAAHIFYHLPSASAPELDFGSCDTKGLLHGKVEKQVGRDVLAYSLGAYIHDLAVEERPETSVCAVSVILESLLSKPVVDVISATLCIFPSDNFISIIARASLHHSVEDVRAAIQKVYEPVVVEAMEIARPLNAIYTRKEPADREHLQHVVRRHEDDHDPKFPNDGTNASPLHTVLLADPERVFSVLFGESHLTGRGLV
ncbi:hypothetical protein GGF50DRAFT_46950 [Schizophyllum commune]